MNIRHKDLHVPHEGPNIRPGNLNIKHKDLGIKCDGLKREQENLKMKFGHFDEVVYSLPMVN